MSKGFTPLSQMSRNSNQAKKAFNPPKCDHMVEIVSYDHNQAAIVGKWIKDGGVNELVAYKIAPNKVQKGDGQKFTGFCIDKAMELALKPGRRVVMERAQWHSNDIAIEGIAGKGKVYHTTKVINSTAQGPTKFFAGLFTAEKAWDKDRIATVQSWAPQAFLATDAAAVAAYAAKLDERAALSAELIEKGQHAAPRLGFMIRAISDNGADWTCFDSTHPFDQRVEETDAGKAYLPLTKKEFLEICKGYAAHIKQAYPSFIAQGHKLEVLTYTNYLASRESNEMETRHDFSPLRKMTSYSCKICPQDSDEEAFSGKNMGVRGFIELTQDQKILDLNGDQVGKTQRDLVQKLHANNWLGDIRSMVKAANGGVVNLDKGLTIAPVVAAAPVAVQQQPEPEVELFSQEPEREESVFDDLEHDPFGQM